MIFALTKMGSSEGHFNVSYTARGKPTRWCPQTTTFRKESRSRESDLHCALITISQTPYTVTARQAKQAHECGRFCLTGGF